MRRLLLLTIVLFSCSAAYSADSAEIAALREKADSGDTLAQLELGFIYSAGVGVPKDEEESLKWFRMASARDYEADEIVFQREQAEAGNASSQYWLGMKFGSEEDAADRAEGAKWLLAAAEQGRELAQYLFDLMYVDQSGMPVDGAEAARRIRVLAEAGDVDAQFNLGWINFIGFGVPKNYIEASEWFLKAADQGKADAHTGLGLLYMNKAFGLGQNFVESYARTSVAISLGATGIRGHLAIAEEMMTEEQIAEAKDRAQELLDKLGRN